MPKAFIENLDGGENINVLFNPKEYKIAKSNTYQRAQTSGGNVPAMRFANGNPATMTVQLFFDTYEKKEDVRKYTDKIAKLMEVAIREEGQSQKLRPPRIKFHWGLNWTFKAVITQMSQNFNLFLQNGTPVRATVDITMQQVEDEAAQPSQNPTSGGNAGRRAHVVEAGETLDMIAFQELGDANRWRHIADANRLHDPLNLKPGSVLVVEPEE
jgi:nucleoid-associated protein YgaU